MNEVNGLHHMAHAARKRVVQKMPLLYWKQGDGFLSLSVALALFMATIMDTAAVAAVEKTETRKAYGLRYAETLDHVLLMVSHVRLSQVSGVYRPWK